MPLAVAPFTFGFYGLPTGAPFTVGFYGLPKPGFYRPSAPPGMGLDLLLDKLVGAFGKLQKQFGAGSQLSIPQVDPIDYWRRAFSLMGVTPGTIGETVQAGLGLTQEALGRIRDFLGEAGSEVATLRGIREQFLNRLLGPGGDALEQAMLQRGAEQIGRQGFTSGLAASTARAQALGRLGAEARARATEVVGQLLPQIASLPQQALATQLHGLNVMAGLRPFEMSGLANILGAVSGAGSQALEAFLGRQRMLLEQALAKERGMRELQMGLMGMYGNILNTILGNLFGGM